MNNHHIKTLLFLLPLLLAAGCQKVLELDEGMTRQQLVLNGVPSEGQQMSLHFAYSNFFLDTTFNHPVENVDMEVIVNGTSFRPVEIEKCNYKFNYTIQEDDQVSVTIHTPTQCVTAHSYVPRAPILRNLSSRIDSSGSFNLLRIKFTIEDHPNYNDYYCFTIERRDSGLYHHPIADKYDTIDTVFRNVYFSCFDKDLTQSSVAASEAIGGYFYSQLLTTDKRIDGTNHPTELIVIMTRDTNERKPYLHQFALRVETATPERYNYLSEVASSTSMMQLITEPAPVHGNVENALGLFAGNAVRRYELDVDPHFWDTKQSTKCKHTSTTPSPVASSTVK